MSVTSSLHLIPFLTLLLLCGPQPTHSQSNKVQNQKNVVKNILKSLEDSSSKTHSSTGTRTTRTPSWVTNEEATLLDVFAEVTKDILTHKMIPDTSVICDWNWSHFRCEPFCDCVFQPKWGDYHLGRSCRDAEEVVWDDAAAGGHEKDMCHLPPDTKYVLVLQSTVRNIQFIKSTLQTIGSKVQTKMHHGRLRICDAAILNQSGGGTTNGIGISDDGQWIRTPTHSNPILGYLNSPAEKLLEKPFKGLQTLLKCEDDGITLMDLQQDETTSDVEFRPITHFIPSYEKN